ncbi:uncharacterized protein METZ01_LOCUS176127 [marine metagenome]|uniref:Uncharacterized protein n=1 Tax=marine metagenome TaxID=408172 RepID=A0A382CDA0_9ZZZZ
MYVTMKKFLKVINSDRYLTATALYHLPPSQNREAEATSNSKTFCKFV